MAHLIQEAAFFAAKAVRVILPQNRRTLSHNRSMMRSLSCKHTIKRPDRNSLLIFNPIATPMLRSKNCVHVIFRLYRMNGSVLFRSQQDRIVSRKASTIFLANAIRSSRSGWNLVYKQSTKKLRSRSDADIRYPVLNKLSKNCKKETFLLLYISSSVFPAKAQKKS